MYTLKKRKLKPLALRLHQLRRSRTPNSERFSALKQTLFKSSSSNIGGRHFLGTKRLTASGSSPNADATLVFNSTCSKLCLPKQWPIRIIGTAAVRWRSFEKGLLSTRCGQALLNYHTRRAPSFARIISKIVRSMRLASCTRRQLPTKILAKQ